MARHDEVLIALRQIIRATDLYSRKLSKVAGLTAPQLLVLQAIKPHGELTMGDIANEVSVSQATVTTILDRLEKRGLIERKRGEQDKRRVYASLTGEGGAILERAPTPLQEEFMARFEQLQDWEQTLILSSLQRVAAMMNAGDIDASPVLDLGAIDRAQPATEERRGRHRTHSQTDQK
ncbi:Transcriptional regulator, MarR family [Alloalcanivorax dieselolei B5]|uniref:Transcriptional regulator, MarR family n=1 Tax=Alcanivorax dieselolei (strain DSM 16502 / CGMCC 1.3690 / MCCC 1A00001 / B-5) TaxID=930169 RepID=K0CCA1_ALCDB|nr:MarR family transcriptional regulator [Alloalcanivorax dieselolei]AFT69171.1 Transcriptional regulator, MarR family [Alloalcanivorax dieselolei B5]GGJ83047.1 MarR family transcriptional regulator [Alloalcanivorax dieselolei]